MDELSIFVVVLPPFHSYTLFFPSTEVYESSRVEMGGRNRRKETSYLLPGALVIWHVALCFRCPVTSSFCNGMLLEYNLKVGRQKAQQVPQLTSSLKAPLFHPLYLDW